MFVLYFFNSCYALKKKVICKGFVVEGEELKYMFMLFTIFRNVVFNNIISECNNKMWIISVFYSMLF